MTKKKDSPWSTTAEVLEYFKFARKTLSRRMKRLSYGVHYYRKDTGKHFLALDLKFLSSEKFLLAYICTLSIYFLKLA